ncbi:MAG: flagellar filament outer layer protein FlaA [Spirochaetaceae bacterium]|jgi:hypothetical protein|nr:flagellar filament outer layer protein FlaA [Spirochaetaceae bacterium]
MKRLFVFVAFAWAAVGTIFADENVLIDFSKLTPDIFLDQEGVLPQNKQTLMDFSRNAGTSITPDQRSLMRTSLAIPNWKIELASSSRTIVNEVESYTKVTASRQFENVMGVRVHFPVAAYNSWASIKPPFDIPAYDFDQVADDGNVTENPPENFNTTQSRFEDGYGVLKNVGAIKSLAVQVYGINAAHSLSAILIDGNGRSQTIFLGYLDFDGWATLAWDNPQYINQVRARTLRIYQLYPSYAPYVRFGGFIIQRDGGHEGGDFVTYFKDVSLVYDKAQLETEKDIDDESEWGILQEREKERQRAEFANFGKDQIFRFIESEKMATQPYFTDPSRQQQQGQPAAGGQQQAAPPAAQ